MTSVGRVAAEKTEAVAVVESMLPNGLVCQWAARALRNFSSIPRVVDAAIRVVQDSAADLDVRHNALAAIEAVHLEPRQSAALQAVLTDPELGSSVGRVLARKERG